MSLCEEIRFLTDRALWETENLVECIPDELWAKRYDGLPMWKYVFHTLYSLDRWYMNPNDPKYRDPYFYEEGMADLNVITSNHEISKNQMKEYLKTIQEKIKGYIGKLEDSELEEKPERCEMTRFCLILGQFRHWHRHMGIIYGFIVVDTGKWPYALNMTGEYPMTPMPNYYD